MIDYFGDWEEDEDITVYIEGAIVEPSVCGCHPQLAGLCFLGFVNFLGVGSVNNWSTVYFSDTLLTTPFCTSLGYAFFQLFVTAGQLCSDFIVMNCGPKNVLVFSGLLASMGVAIVVYAPSNMFLTEGATCAVSMSCTIFGTIGYAITGMGLSSIGPILISQTVSYET
jgi:MFS family permease